MEWADLLFRWGHVVAGVMWIGHLYFFNFVNSQVAKTYDAESKKKVLPEIMPRALYWFRWGAAFTWITGFLLLGIVFYMGDTLLRSGVEMSKGPAIGIGFGLLIVGWVVYDLIWKAMAKSETAAAILSFVLIVGVAFGLSFIYSGRALMIHVGAIFGTIMAANVWMRIWPAQRKIIAGAKDGTPVDAALAPMATLRSKHNTYMSVPLIAFMLNSHFTTVYQGALAEGLERNWIVAAGIIAVGWGFTKFLYTKSASEAPTRFRRGGDSASAAPSDKAA
jgi:uncharacterized membrane protein